MPGWQPTHYSRAQLEERRLAALSTWKARLERNGSLNATIACGAVSRLTSVQQEHLRTLLREGAPAHGFPDETWTTRRVTELIGRHFDVWYHHDHVRKILRRLGFTPQMPDGRAAERNELRIASWREQVAPELKKKGR